MTHGDGIYFKKDVWPRGELLGKVYSLTRYSRAQVFRAGAREWLVIKYLLARTPSPSKNRHERNVTLSPVNTSGG